VTELCAGAGNLGEHDIGRPLALAGDGRDLQVLVVDALRRYLRLQADHVRHRRLVVPAREQPPDQQPREDEQQQKEQPQPPVALRRRAGRLRNLLGRSG
jgi:hypothetical protein